MHKKLGFVFMAFGAVMILAALSLLIYNAAEENSAVKAVNDAVSQIEEYIEENEDIGKTAEDLPYDEPVAYINGNAYIGYISAPSVGLDVPIMSDWSYDKLKIAPCRHFGTAYGGDLVIAGHNYKKVFGKIKSLKQGESVTFTDMNGFVYKYEVASIETLEATAVDEMKSSSFELTLYTCTYGGKARVAVRCRRIY